MQHFHPIAFESRKLKPHECRLSTYQKEMKAILHALEKWRQYLLGSKFTILTDHNSLKLLLSQPVLSEEQAKWVDRLQIFDFNIAYKKGKDNVVTDALSRLPPDPSLHSLSHPQPSWLNDLVLANQAHKDFDQWTSKVGHHPDWSLQDTRLLYKS